VWQRQDVQGVRMMAAVSLVAVVTLRQAAAGSSNSSSGRQQGQGVRRRQKRQGPEGQVRVLPLWLPNHL
jgi:hypothetical protein